MATCPRVVKCAVAALAVLVVIVGAAYSYHCRDVDRIAAEQLRQDDASTAVTEKRDAQIGGMVKDINEIKIDVAVIRATVAPKSADDNTTASSGRELKLKG